MEQNNENLCEINGSLVGHTYCPKSIPKTTHPPTPKKSHQHNVWANMSPQALLTAACTKPLFWLSLWNACLRHRSLFTVLIKWKAWNDWGDGGLLSLEVCVWVSVTEREREAEGERVCVCLGNVCSCREVFDTVVADATFRLPHPENTPCFLALWPLLPSPCQRAHLPLGPVRLEGLGDVSVTKGRAGDGHRCPVGW